MLFLVLATSKIISGCVLTCDSAHSWQPYTGGERDLGKWEAHKRCQVERDNMRDGYGEEVISGKRGVRGKRKKRRKEW